VNIKLLGDLPSGAGRIEEARHAAAYLSKYVGKDFDQAKMGGLHRYDKAQGFEPERVKVYGKSLDQAIQKACGVMHGEEPSLVTTSESWRDWQGPPAVALQWPS
jgi:hypothetical protein